MLLATFFLGMVGYAGLAYLASAAAWGRAAPLAQRCTVLVIAAHVVLVWTVRYELHFSRAVRNGYIGFVLFHGALLALLLSSLLPFPRARYFLWVGFAVVTVGAVGAVFRYDIVALYRIPVLTAAFLGITATAAGWRYGRNATRPARPEGEH